MNWKKKIKNLKTLSFLLILIINPGLYPKDVIVSGVEGNKKHLDPTDPLMKKKAVLEKVLKYGTHKERKAAMREVPSLPSEYCQDIYNILSDIIQNDRDNSVKIVSLQTLSKMNDTSHSNEIIAALKDKSPDVKEAAISAIQKMKLEPAASEILEMLKKQDFNKNQTITNMLINTLADIDANKIGFDFLHEKVKSPLTITEYKAAIALYFGKTKDTRSEDALIQMASDENENTIVRSYAISSLSKLKSTRSIEPIRNILNEINERKSKTDQKKYSSLKLYAMSALVALGDSNVLGELIAYAKDDDASVRLRAIQQLADLEDDSIYELIEYKAQRDPDRRVQTQAKKILEQMKKKREEKKKTESNSSNSNQPIENLKIDGKDSDGNLIHSSDYGTDIVPEKKLNP